MDIFCHSRLEIAEDLTPAPAIFDLIELLPPAPAPPLATDLFTVVKVRTLETVENRREPVVARRKNWVKACMIERCTCVWACVRVGGWV